jgi:nucleoside 2-deoxyribosyltransferase
MSHVRKKIFVLQPLTDEFEPIFALIRSAALSVLPDIEIVRINEVQSEHTIIASLYESIETADLIICDISNSNSNGIYELGYAHGIRKPVLMIARNSSFVPFDIKGVQSLIYDRVRGHSSFIKRLGQLIEDALNNPNKYSNLPTTQHSVNNVFISYSHRDKEFLRRLIVHLRPLEKERLIDYWADTKLKAGDSWRAKIEEALRRARVAILLISADFLASDFIVDNELPPLLAKAESQGTRIIPVIIKPCRFTRDKNLSRFQAINDPSSPLINLPEGEQEDVYNRISETVERSLV